ncbi:MFS transporter [Streptomyces triticirhizae]|uniref:MFS transporter n=1 Tax=Streptomyces triticirhizae TaxID=2483353 RepID=A0A3M2L2Q6_9ACTN|nr:MFS transporter [Streptomyces triticirhizae]RMI31992.1 MFS transporter [Streptomyces triticirhizae]
MPDSQGATSPAKDTASTITPHATAILTIILCVQLLDAIDITVMNMAVPNIQQDFSMSVTTLSWVLNGYTLAYGGLLLLGGRVGDIIGHRKGLMIGVTVFTLASLVGAVAQDSWMLLAARAIQGAGAAMTAPCALALIVTSFRTEKERTKAFGISVMAQGLGFAGGLIIGGMLTDLISWRSVLFINVPIGIVLLIATPRFIPESPGRRGKFDFGGALSATVGMGSIVYGFVHASEEGWSEPSTLAAFAVGVILLGTLVVISTRHSEPVLNLKLLINRNRGGGYLTFVCSGAALFGMFFFLTQFVQDVLDMRPLMAGFAFLPMAITMMIAPRWIAPPVIERFDAKTAMVTGLVLVFVSMVWLTQVSASTEYWSGILGPMALAGVGVGMLNPPLIGTILSSVKPTESGAASGVLQTMGMVGGSIGTAVLVTIFTSATDSPDPGLGAKEILADGIGAACIGGAGFALVGLLLVIGVIRTPKEAPAASEEAA